ncbi:hypothetical protein OG604_50815 [Streptomyces sp. NBC_01231]|nr:hypothetical protein OG604_00050 [Streptomyces sp. NBC_01231]WSQ15313.1 hypothetical protein OG604_50815 [Streptomyces sp. NBC_01231]
MDSNDTRRRTTTNTEDPVRSTAYARLLKRMQGPADYWDRPTGDWGPRPARTRGITASTARADANSAYRLATRALRRGELNAARAAFTLALTEQHPGAAFRIVLTEPQRLMVFIPTGSGKTESSLWVVRHLMEAARWGHADAQQLLDGIQTRPLHPLEQVLADAQHAAAEGLWSGLTFTCPPLAYEAQDDEFYPAVRDLLTQLLKAPAAALEAGPSSRARALPASPQQAALPASRPLIALPPTSSGISQEPLDTLNGSRIEAEDPAATPSTVREALELAGNGEPACLTPFNNRSFWGKAAPVKMLCLGGWGVGRSWGASRGESAGALFLRSAEADPLGNGFPVAGGGMSVVRGVASFGDPEEACWENVIRHAVILVSGSTETAVMPRVLPAETCVPQGVAAAIRASSARSTPGLWDPLLGCPRTRPATVWMVAVIREGSVQVWDPVSGLAIGSLTSDGPTPPGRVLPLDTGLAVSMPRRNAAVALLACTAGAVDEDGGSTLPWLQNLPPGEREVVFACTAAAGWEWEEAAAVLRVRAPAAVGERLRRKVNRLDTEQRRRTAQRWVEYPGAPTADSGPSRLNLPLAAMPSAL